MTTYIVGYLVGSLATQSIYRKLAEALIRLAPDNLEFSEIEFGELPLYSYDYDENFPDVARAFKGAIKAADAILFVTPEYNRSRMRSTGPAGPTAPTPSRESHRRLSALRPARSAPPLGSSTCGAYWASSTRRR